MDCRLWRMRFERIVSLQPQGLYSLCPGAARNGGCGAARHSNIAASKKQDRLPKAAGKKDRSTRLARAVVMLRMRVV